MLIWLLARVAAAGCTTQTLSEAIDEAEEAFVGMETAAFDTAAAQARSALTCQEQPITPILCAGVHRVEALSAFVDDDDDATILSFQAMLSTQPGYDLSSELAPPGSPLREALDRARQYDTSDPFPLGQPTEGWLTVDGRRAMAAPSGRPFVFQRLLDDGAVAQTAYVPLGKPLPSYDTRDLNRPEPVDATSRRGRPLMWVGVAVAAAGAGAYGAAFATRSSYTDAVQAGDEERIRSAHGLTNGLAIGGLVGLGTGGTLVLVGAL